MFVLINLRLVNDSNSMFQKKNDAMDFPKDDAFGVLSKTMIWGCVKDEDLGFSQRRGFGMFPKTRIRDFSKDEDLGLFQRR